MKTVIFLLAVALVVFADELSDCKCSDGYVPMKDESGVVNCYGSVLKSILPCNIVIKPRCVCNEDATSVVQDSTGTWCSKLSEGKEEKRWACENKEEWDAFFKEHPESKP